MRKRGKMAGNSRRTWHLIQRDNSGDSGESNLWKEVDVKLEDLLPEEMLDKEIYYDEGVGGKWSFHFPGNVMQIYPGNAIGLGSEPEELEVARNTVQIHALVENALGELEYRKALESRICR